MKRFLTAAAAAGVLAIASASSALAQSEPTVDQIYSAANGGHLDQAQQMMTGVLAAHPNSARAHYVQAELYDREGNAARARSELATAERINPGLSFESPGAVQVLKGHLGLANGQTMMMMRRAPAPAVSHFPWGAVLFIVAAVAVLLMVFRRRTYVPYSGAPAATGPGYGPGPGYPPGYGPAPMGGGMGSNIAGGLASGLAVGAGVVAGEELAHHFLDGGHNAAGGVIPPAEASDASFDNSNMGGNDFGMNDPGAGWDDSGGGGFDGGGGGGGDWS